VDTTTGGFSLRLNDEIEGQLDVTLHDDTELDGGNAISLVAIERINQFTPAEEDANAAHITLLRLRSGWVGLVNLVYNAEIADSFETAAAEFLDAAEASLAQGLFRPFADSLHSSVELLAQDSSTSTPNTQASLAADLPVGTDARRPPTDGSAPTRDARFVALHNRVADLRAPARYAIGSFDLPTDDATTLLGEARAMQQELRDLIARPGD
jgi:hypothetical protein